jgi:hypothetical protein
MMRRPALMLAGFTVPLVVLLTAVGMVGALAAPESTRSAGATLPNLGMARLTDISAGNEGGQTRLRFSATIVNTGSGAFELAASRTDTGSPFAVVQRLAGGDAPTPAVSLVWGGDGHNHWHVRNLERYELERLDNGVKVGTGAKGGFCFFDTTFFRSLPGSPASRVYSSAGCGTQSSLDVTMGLSIGWGDRYGATLPDQYIDISGLSSGRYRLHAQADPDNWFAEMDETDNETWVDLQISVNGGGKTRVRVLGYGPSA